GLHALFPLDAESDERADLAAELDGFLLGQVAQMLDFKLPVLVLVDRERVDDAHRSAFPQPFEFGDHLAVKVRVVEPEHDQLHRSDSHVTSFAVPFTWAQSTGRPSACTHPRRVNKGRQLCRKSGPGYSA